MDPLSTLSKILGYPYPTLGYPTLDSSPFVDGEPFSDDPNSKLSKIVLTKGDITKLNVDVIVNDAHKRRGSRIDKSARRGIDRDVHIAAGPGLLEWEMEHNSSCKTGDVYPTPAFNLERAGVVRIFHTVGPRDEDHEKFRSCYKKSLDLLRHEGLRSVALPSISTGILSYPKVKAIKTSILAVGEWLSDDEAFRSVDRIVFATFTDEDYEIYKEMIPQLLKDESLIPFSDDPKSKLSKIALTKGDITRLYVDVIVNDANEEIGVEDGIDGVIHTAAGRGLSRWERRYNAQRKTGDVFETPAFRLQRAGIERIYHAVGPRQEDLGQLRSCYKKSLDLLRHQGYQSIALPSISTGIKGYPQKKAAQVAIQAVGEWLSDDEAFRSVDKIVFCTSTDEDYEIYKEMIPQLQEDIFPTPFSDDPKSKLSKIVLTKGDITKLHVDVIVNAANEHMRGGGGIDGVIHKAAGPKLLEWEKSHRAQCKTGDVFVTPAFDLASAGIQRIFHTVGPRGENPGQLRSCYKNSLDTLLPEEFRSVALPCISTGIFGYPQKKAAEVAIQAVGEWLSDDEAFRSVDRIVFCTFTDEDYEIYKEMIPKLLNDA